MKLQTYRIKLGNSACHFVLILMLIFEIDFAVGLQWITKPSVLNTCNGQTVNLTWEYIKEPSEEIRQLQWLFNRTQLIAYFSVKQGFIVDSKFQGRVARSCETGILLMNITAKDIGSYTLYTMIVWEESPNMLSVDLNVIEPIMEPECTCQKLLKSPEWRSGQMFNLEHFRIIIMDAHQHKGYHLEINASFCCPKGPAIEYCENDPQKLCVPIWNPFNQTESTTRITYPANLTERTTQSRIVTTERAPTGNIELDHILIPIQVNRNMIIILLVMNCFSLMAVLGIFIILCRNIWNPDDKSNKPCLINLPMKNLSSVENNEEKRDYIICSLQSDIED